MSFKGQGYEFSHLIQVAKKGLNMQIYFDFSAFDNPNVQFNITSTDTGDILATIQGKKGLVSKSMNFSENGGYDIMEDNQILGVIEVVDDINNANLQSIRLTLYICLFIITDIKNKNNIFSSQHLHKLVLIYR